MVNATELVEEQQRQETQRERVFQLHSFPAPPSRTIRRLNDVLQELTERCRQAPGSHKATAAVALVLLALVYRQVTKGGEVKVNCQRNPLTEAIMALLAREDQTTFFRSGLSTWNGHLATLTGFLRSQPPVLPCTQELITTEDGGHFALHWYSEKSPMMGQQVQALQADLRKRPIVLILHGVNDSAQKAYMRHLAHMVCTYKGLGWRGVCMNFRGCGDLILTSAQAYDASKTGDVALAVDTIHARFPDAPLFLVGFSLGANIMTKYLGEEGPRVIGKVAAAVSISNPWAFHPHIESLHYTRKPNSLRRLYAWIYSVLVAHEYKRYVQRHTDALAERLKAVARPLSSMTTLRELDEHVTVPLNGWRDLEHYMVESSSSDYLDRVAVPLLGINAEDDPLVSKEALDYTVRRGSANPHLILVTTKRGGHIGWGNWADRLTVEYLHACAEVQGLMQETRQQPRARL